MNKGLPRTDPSAALTPQDTLYLRRALELARRALPAEVEPNPPVGAVIATPDRILGEGYHRFYGGPHAEVEALRQVQFPEALPQATLYVTLEPCCHSGKKTPPCVPTVIQSGIRRVVIGQIDPNPAVRGEGIRQLRAAGLEVILASDSRPFRRLLRHFETNIRFQRPYLTLKWAQTPGPTKQFPFPGGIIGSRRTGRWPISGFWGRVWGHRLRAAHSHIAVGYRTWVLDSPALTTRLFPGSSPKRIVFYRPGRLLPESTEDVLFFPLSEVNLATLQKLYQEHRVGSLLVEGGAQILEQFLAAGLYDEVQVLVSFTAPSPPPAEAIWAPAWPRLMWRRTVLSPTEELWRGRPFNLT